MTVLLYGHLYDPLVCSIFTEMNGGQQSTDPDNGDSRKQLSQSTLSEHESESTSATAPIVQKSPYNNVHFKILVPSIAAGAIIGKGGEAIGQIQKETGAKVKMSKTNDFYPGTTERVCLIQGTVDAITAMHSYIMEKIYEKPDPNPRATSDGRLNVERHKQVKILVPNSTAGMIIGKSGIYITEIKEHSGAYIQISQKSKEINLTERCVTIAGDMDQNRVAVSLILAKLAEDPQSSSCPNISYSDMAGPVASAYPTGSPFAQHLTSQAGSGSGSSAGGAGVGADFLLTAAAGMGQSAPPGLPGYATGCGGPGPPTATAIALAASGSLNSSLSSSGSLTAVSLEGLRCSLRHSGFTEEAVVDIVNAMCVLAHYGLLNIGTLGMTLAASPGLPTSNTPMSLLHSPASSFNLGTAGGGLLAAAAAAAAANSGAALLRHPVGGSGAGPSRLMDDFVAGVPGPTLYDFHRGHSHQLASAVFSSPPPPPASLVARPRPAHGSNTMNSGAATNTTPVGRPASAGKTKEVEVPESLVAAIFSGQGKSLHELELSTHTSIELCTTPRQSNPSSAPVRVVTISGGGTDVDRAAVVIGQRIQNEEHRRRQQLHPVAHGVGQAVAASPDLQAISGESSPPRSASLPAASGVPLVQRHNTTPPP